MVTAERTFPSETTQPSKLQKAFLKSGVDAVSSQVRESFSGLVLSNVIQHVSSTKDDIVERGRKTCKIHAVILSKHKHLKQQ